MVQTLSVIAWVALLSFLVSREHYGLPTPKSSDVDENTGMHQFNEANALQLVGELSSPEGGIHYRIVGTQELVAAENHLLETLYRLKQQLDASELSKTVSCPQKGARSL